jgi:hypothetical protein
MFQMGKVILQCNKFLLGLVIKCICPMYPSIKICFSVVKPCQGKKNSAATSYSIKQTSLPYPRSRSSWCDKGRICNLSYGSILCAFYPMDHTQASGATYILSGTWFNMIRYLTWWPDTWDGETTFGIVHHGQCSHGFNLRTEFNFLNICSDKLDAQKLARAPTRKHY